MFAYLCLGTRDLNAAIVFYDATLAPLGLQRFASPGAQEISGWAGWRLTDDPDGLGPALWICTPFNGQPASVGNGTMVALQAASWAAVQTFHAAALQHGGSSEGEPGLRPHYAPDFYAAYVRDPDGNKLAAVCRGRTHAR
ncbi:MAG TPA: lactoylglutathione lyase [Curvibacter sp.]|nr:lactoylglutathione lyase [Curvibacter sp.]